MTWTRRSPTTASSPRPASGGAQRSSAAPLKGSSSNASRPAWWMAARSSWMEASNDSVLDINSLKGQLHQRYHELEARLEEKSDHSSRTYEKKNNRYLSATDSSTAVNPSSATSSTVQ